VVTDAVGKYHSTFSSMKNQKSEGSCYLYILLATENLDKHAHLHAVQGDTHPNKGVEVFGIHILTTDAQGTMKALRSICDQESNRDLVAGTISTDRFGVKSFQHIKIPLLGNQTEEGMMLRVYVHDTSKNTAKERPKPLSNFE
jgi:hypothetical protein